MNKTYAFDQSYISMLFDVVFDEESGLDLDHGFDSLDQNKFKFVKGMSNDCTQVGSKVPSSRTQRNFIVMLVTLWVYLFSDLFLERVNNDSGRFKKFENFMKKKMTRKSMTK